MFEKRKDAAADNAPAFGRGAEPRSEGSAPPTPVSRPAAAGAAATIGRTIFIKGELSGDEDVVIAGQFEGAIDLLNQSLTVVEGGQVRADVKAHVVVIQGEVTGDVEGVEKVMIVRTGRMQGNIKSPRVILEDGAEFNGSIDMAAPEAEAAAARAARPAAEGAAKPKTPAQGAGGETRQPKQPDAAS